LERIYPTIEAAKDLRISEVLDKINEILTLTYFQIMTAKKIQDYVIVVMKEYCQLGLPGPEVLLLDVRIIPSVNL